MHRITGLGTDIVEVERIAEKMRKENGFRELVFAPAEIDYCEKMTHKYRHYAARFAAKEAFFKAMGTGWAASTAFNEIEIANDAYGKPFLQLHGTTAKWAKEKGAVNILVSLSHADSMATAVVMIES